MDTIPKRDSIRQIVTDMILFNQGHSLRLRQTKPEDAPILLRAYQNDAFIRLYRANNATLTEEELAFLLAERATQPSSKIGYVEFMIEHKRRGAIGVTALGDYSSLHKRAEYVIGLFDNQSRLLMGYGMEAALLLLDLAFNHYHLNKIYSYIYEYNEFAQKNIIKFGFEHEGTLKNHHYLVREQRFVNLYLNGLTQDSFRNNENMRRYSRRLLGRDITQPPQVIRLSPENQVSAETQKQFLEKLLAKKKI
jgi:ribosomal-protein-alanine N-acetyltransferase